MPHVPRTVAPRRSIGSSDLKQSDTDPYLMLDELPPTNYAPGEFPGAPWHPRRSLLEVLPRWCHNALTPAVAYARFFWSGLLRDLERSTPVTAWGAAVGLSHSVVI